MRDYHELAAGQSSAPVWKGAFEMKNARVLILSVVFVLTISLHAQIPEDQQTLGSLNGRLWISMSRELKVAFIGGFLEAFRACMLSSDLSELRGAVGVGSMIGAKMNIGEYQESLDGFYLEPTNRQIPIFLVMNWSAMKSKGASEKELKEYEIKMHGFTK